MPRRVSIQRMQQDHEVKVWCNQFLTRLNTASQALSQTKQSDILSVYTDPLGISAEQLLENSLLPSLIQQVFEEKSVHESYTIAAQASLPNSNISAEDRKKKWTTFRTLFGKQTTKIISEKVNTTEQQYWSPRSKEEQGPEKFLQNNMHLTLTQEQIDLIRVASLLYFIPRAIQRDVDDQTDDQYAVLSEETQQKWTGSK